MRVVGGLSLYCPSGTGRTGAKVTAHGGMVGASAKGEMKAA